ncbi:MAG: two-component system response regulator [Mastigocladus sp. ERB_26_2]
MKQKISEKRTVLIADDQESYRFLFTFILEQEGWEVSVAKNGREALEKVLKQQPDLLILDNRMPELTGAEVCQCLQLHGIKLAVVMVSSHTNLKTLASSLGIFYFLEKPFEISDFMKIIESAYENFWL